MGVPLTPEETEQMIPLISELGQIMRQSIYDNPAVAAKVDEINRRGVRVILGMDFNVGLYKTRANILSSLVDSFGRVKVMVFNMQDYKFLRELKISVRDFYDRPRK